MKYIKDLKDGDRVFDICASTSNRRSPKMERPMTM